MPHTASVRFTSSPSLSLPSQVIGRQTAVGHVHAPGYVPLPTSLMAEIVGEMRRVYCGEAAEMVAGKREQHRCVVC